MRTPLQKNEKVLLVTYTSWISLVGPALLAVACILGAFFVPSLTWGLVTACVGLLIFVCKYFVWRVNIWVVTNYRVIDEAGLLSHYAKESPLDKINNVSYDQSVWGRVFNYGHVEIQTAAETGATDYYNVYHPKRLKDTITLAQADYKHIQLGNQAVQMASSMGLHSNAQVSITAELEKLFELKEKGVLTLEEYNKAKNKLIN